MDDEKHSTGSEDCLTEEPSSAKLERNFSFLSICGIAVTTGESWVVLGNSLVLAIENGGAPGVIYGFIVDSMFYWIVAASIAELASSIPSAGTVYHWASVTGGRYGRICGWYAGWWNFFAWTVGVAALVSFMSLQSIAIYSTLHPSLQVQQWHIFCSYIACSWTCCFIVLFGNELLPLIESTGTFLILAGFLITVIVCAIMPGTSGQGYASSYSVWADWQNNTGWSSEGFVFCLGMLNAAFAVCAPDIPSHLAEEMPRPKYNVPLAILAQYVSSFVTGLAYLIAIFYATPNLGSILSQNSIFPLSFIYLEATGSRSATTGLLVLTLLPTFVGTIGGFTIAGRTFYALARDNMTPFSGFFASLSSPGNISSSNSPFNATLLVGLLSTSLGCIYLGSARAFNDIAASFVTLTSLSYLATITPHLFTRSQGLLKPGPFYMRGPLGFVINAVSVAYLATFCVVFWFPFSLPVTVANMNYTAVIVAGLTAATTAWWFVRQKDYVGPSDVLGVGDDTSESHRAEK